ncbi:MAG: bifunctional precorrin-2 dehydrogenase/sirohydrochlorin ferrochelatase [Dehalococcoidia bacterium]|nr:bifunctional precorrin-2 dehydrogenase/sirohydrochlorin ferrochelatase [Dehalococcoidia bacterium]HRC61801.1 bifunctional precorrin-2 dehydrogenase/sirohydrochlorin ferrochelatase [Dehalococcoidia bacterium]
MGYYPIFVEMNGRSVLLVGGGHVALEKIGKLVQAGARVTVVAPELIAPIRAFIDRGDASWRQRRYEPGDTEGFDLVMVATDDGEVNSTVAAEARAAGIWVNAADDVRNCDFILPALAQRGTIAIAASTGGSSPALARWLRERLEEFLSDEVVALGDLLADVRRLARERDRACAATCDRTRTPPPLLCGSCPNRITPDAWQAAIDDELRALLLQGEYEAARARLVRTLGIDRPLVQP